MAGDRTTGCVQWELALDSSRAFQLPTVSVKNGQFQASISLFLSIQ